MVMPLPAPRFLVLAAGLLFGPAAWASGDYMPCSPRWTLKNADLVCNNVAFLNPGNDSRVNLQFLRTDRNLATLSAVVPPEGTDPPPNRDAPFAIASLIPDFRAETDGPGPQRQELNALLAQLDLAPFTAEIATFASGEGNRCRSDGFASAQAFVQQVVAAPLPPDERKTLAQARLALLGDCQAAKPAAAVASPAGQDFARYLSAAGKFYGGDLTGAQEGFDALATVARPWLKETALYMAARTALNRAQQHAVDQYGEFALAGIDQGVLARASRGLRDYLAAYPKGLYAASAQGLLRRAAWFGQDPAAQSEANVQVLARPDPVRPMVVFPDAVMEVDVKFLWDAPPPARIKDATLLAVVDLMRMRTAGLMSKDPPHPVIALSELTAQQPLFAEQPRLFRYLLAAYAFFVEADPAKTLAGLPDTMPGPAPDYLAFSEAALRGLALEAKGQWAEAGQLWAALLPLVHHPLQKSAVQVAIAMNDERDGHLDQVFAAGSPVASTEIRRALLARVAGAELLRKVAGDGAGDPRDRAVARFTLLYKDLTHRAAGAFLDDLAGPTLPPTDAAGPARPSREEEIVPASLSLFQWPGGETQGGHHLCPSLRDTAGLLKANPNSAKGLLCFGDFILANGLDGYFLDQPVDKDDLGGTPERFAGRHLTRLDAYRQIIADPAAAADDKAYALYRAINCFATVGNNHCGSQVIEKSERKGWFQTLETKYKTTVWAQEQKYYW